MGCMGLEMELWEVAQLPQQKTQVPHLPSIVTKQLQSTCTALAVVRHHSGCMSTSQHGQVCPQGTRSTRSLWDLHKAQSRTDSCSVSTHPMQPFSRRFAPAVLQLSMNCPVQMRAAGTGATCKHLGRAQSTSVPLIWGWRLSSSLLGPAPSQTHLNELGDRMCGAGKAEHCKACNQHEGELSSAAQCRVCTELQGGECGIVTVGAEGQHWGGEAGAVGSIGLEG